MKKQTEQQTPEQEILTRRVGNGEGRLSAGQREFLTYDNPMLVPCTLDQQAAEYVFTFQTQGFRTFSYLRQEDRLSQYRLLMNCAKLESLSEEYVFSLDPDNLMYDFNLLPRVLLRDAALDRPEAFAPKYKALVASVLCPKYHYQDFLQGGQDLYTQQKDLKAIADKTSVQEVAGAVSLLYIQEWRSVHTEKKLVNRRSVLLCRILLPALAVGLAVALVFCFLAYQRQIPFRDAQLKANSDYLSGNYVAVADDLESYDTDELSASIRCILARSYASVEGLDDDKRDHVLSSLTPKTEDAFTNFWIELGRGNCEKAIDLAKQLNDDELLLPALIKQQATVENDSTLSGSDKAAQLDDLKSQIDALKEKVNAINAEAAAADTATDAAAASTAATTSAAVPAPTPAAG